MASFCSPRMLPRKDDCLDTDHFGVVLFEVDRPEDALVHAFDVDRQQVGEYAAPIGFKDISDGKNGNSEYLAHAKPRHLCALLGLLAGKRINSVIIEHIKFRFALAIPKCRHSDLCPSSAFGRVRKRRLDPALC